MVKPSRSEIMFAGVVASCIGAVLIVASWETWPNPTVFGTKGEWVGAITTFAAAATAMFLALWSRRHDKLDSMTDGAFELVAADFVIRKVKSEAQLFRYHLADSVKNLHQLDEKISDLNSKIRAAELEGAPGAALAEKLRSLERFLEITENQRQQISDGWGAKFRPRVELLQTQMATIPHEKVADFDARIGLGLVKVKALLRGSEGLAMVSITRTVLLEHLDKVLGFLEDAERGVPTAEKHIEEIGRTH